MEQSVHNAYTSVHNVHLLPTYMIPVRSAQASQISSFRDDSGMRSSLVEAAFNVRVNMKQNKKHRASHDPSDWSHRNIRHHDFIKCKCVMLLSERNIPRIMRQFAEAVRSPPSQSKTKQFTNTGSSILPFQSRPRSSGYFAVSTSTRCQ